MTYGFISILADGSAPIPAGYEVMTLAKATELQTELAAEVTSIEGTWGIIAIQFPHSIRGAGYGGDINDESANGLSAHGDWANGIARVFLVTIAPIPTATGAPVSSYVLTSVSKREFLLEN